MSQGIYIALCFVPLVLFLVAIQVYKIRSEPRFRAGELYTLRCRIAKKEYELGMCTLAERFEAERRARDECEEQEGEIF